MSIAVGNPFALLAEEGSAPAPKKATQKPKSAPATTAAVAPQTNQQQKNAKPQQAVAKPQKQNAAPATSTTAAPVAPVEGHETHVRDHNKARSERGNPRGRGRDFERHSGTGRGTELKKDGAGKGNWGKEDDGKPRRRYNTNGKDLDQEEVASPVAAAKEGEAAPAKEGEVKEGEAAPAPAKPVEEVDNTKTFDQYLKEKKKAAPKMKLPPARTANEGSVQEQREVTKLDRDADLVYLKVESKKDEKPATTEGKKDEKPSTPAAAATTSTADKKQKQSLQEFLKDVEVPAGRTDRFGSSSRGGRGRGGQRGAPSRSERPPKLSDASAFPTLGK